VLDDAAAYFTKRIKQNKNDAFAYFGRAAAWELLGKPDLAIQDYDTLEDLDPRPFMFDGRGNMWMAKKDYKKAMKDFNKAIYLDPKFAPAYHNRAWVWVVLDEKARALADYREAIVLDPRLVSALYMRGMLYCRLGEFDNALVDFNEAIRIDTNALHAFYGKARAQYGLKRYDDAVTTWQAALEMNNDYSWGLMGWAHFLATCPDENRRDSKKALAMATRAMSLERNPDATFHAMAAAVFADSGDFVEAVRRQELALQDPQFIDVAEETNRLELYRERKPFRQE
jgi:tetratricopeptide (TPR) repeat protein